MSLTEMKGTDIFNRYFFFIAVLWIRIHAEFFLLTKSGKFTVVKILYKKFLHIFLLRSLLEASQLKEKPVFL
jgi:hypothetical protein